MILGFLLVLHLLGAFLWAGGFSAAAIMMRKRARANEAAAGSWEELEKDFLFKGGHVGMALVLLTGTGLIATEPAYFLRQGWLHAKLTFVAFLAVLSAALTLARGGAPGRAALLQGLFVCGVCAVLLLVVLKPF